MSLITANLKKLASLSSVPIYVVGGAVRDYLLDNRITDVDLAAALTPEEMTELCKKAGFTAVPNAPKLGTMKLACGEECYEYTSFRSDSYASDGSHEPVSVKFVKSVEEDAKRRDFTVNALYFDILKETIIDIVNGLSDIDNKVIRAVREPRVVFEEDALRILRMIRFACSLDFTIEPETYKAAKSLSDNLSRTAPERLADEFLKMTVCDTLNGKKGAHTRAIELLVDVGAMRFIIPELLTCIGVKQRPDFHKFDVYGHILATFSLAAPEVRLAALFHDIAKPIQKENTGRMAGHDKTGGEVTRFRLKKLRLSNSLIEETARLVEGHMLDLNCDMSEVKLRRYIQDNRDIIDKLCLLKDADHNGSGLLTGANPSSARLRFVRDKMLEEGVPMSVKELKVNGGDLIALDVPKNRRGFLMKEILKLAADGKTLMTREGQLAFLSRNKFR